MDRYMDAICTGPGYRNAIVNCQVITAHSENHYLGVK